MAVVFPSSPSLNQRFTVAGKEFQWAGSYWYRGRPNNVILDGGFARTEISDTNMHADGGSA
jgi:hypothetical protein